MSDTRSSYSRLPRSQAPDLLVGDSTGNEAIYPVCDMELALNKSCCILMYAQVNG